jgi:hypothetical protein
VLPSFCCLKNFRPVRRVDQPVEPIPHKLFVTAPIGSDRANWVRSPLEARDLSSNLFVLTGTGAHSASHQWVPGVSFPGVNSRPACDTDQLPPSTAEVKNG